MSTELIRQDDVTIRFAGDSGDGMQLAGTQFTASSAMFGNDLATLPNFPAEIRAPAGTIAGVSSFQVHIADWDILTPGDDPDVLVAMNPAALKTNLPRLRPNGVLIIDQDAFSERNLARAGYKDNPLDDPELGSRYRLHPVPVTTLTLNALEDLDLKRSVKTRCKNFFTLGLVYWLFARPLQQSLDWIGSKFSRSPEVAEANRLALQAGFHYGETSEAFDVRWQVGPAAHRPGTYRTINGNEAAALGLLTAARLANKSLVYSSYPITPASEVLHHLSRWKHMDVRTIQTEDEIAAMGSAIHAPRADATGNRNHGVIAANGSVIHFGGRLGELRHPGIRQRHRLRHRTRGHRQDVPGRRYGCRGAPPEGRGAHSPCASSRRGGREPRLPPRQLRGEDSALPAPRESCVGPGRRPN